MATVGVPTTHPQPYLSCRGLQRSFEGPSPVLALRDATFEVRAGEFLAIVGRSGSGKSTLLNILGLLDSPSEGELMLGGVDTRTLSGRERSSFRASQLGFVFQAFHLLPELTALENVLVALTYQGIARGQRQLLALQSLQSMELGHRINAKARTLSGGEQQRVAFARALAHSPALILADEPTGNLDSQTEQQITEILRNLARGGCTVIVVTHNAELATSADRRLVVSDGVVSGASDD